jgi:hypothetical protein
MRRLFKTQNKKKTLTRMRFYFHNGTHSECMDIFSDKLTIRKNGLIAPKIKFAQYMGFDNLHEFEMYIAKKIKLNSYSYKSKRFGKIQLIRYVDLTKYKF